MPETHTMRRFSFRRFSRFFFFCEFSTNYDSLYKQGSTDRHFLRPNRLILDQSVLVRGSLSTSNHCIDDAHGCWRLKVLATGYHWGWQYVQWTWCASLTTIDCQFHMIWIIRGRISSGLLCFFRVKNSFLIWRIFSAKSVGFVKLEYGTFKNGFNSKLYWFNFQFGWIRIFNSHFTLLPPIRMFLIAVTLNRSIGEHGFVFDCTRSGFSRRSSPRWTPSRLGWSREQTWNKPFKLPALENRLYAISVKAI